MKKALLALIWAFPAGRVKNSLLRRAGHRIGSGVRIAPSLVVGCDRADIGDNVTIRFGNIIRGIALMKLGDRSGIGSWNWVSAHPGYRVLSSGAGTLILGFGARIESRNYIDCSGTVEIQDFSAVGGVRCTIQSHNPDLTRMVQTVGRIVIGHHSSVGSNCVILQGAVFPPASALAAHSTLTGKNVDNPRSGLYAGSPAVFKKPLGGGWFERTEVDMTTLEVNGHLGVQDGDGDL